MSCVAPWAGNSCRLPSCTREGARGLGSVQFYIDHDAENHYFTVQDDALPIRYVNWPSLTLLSTMPIAKVVIV